MPYAYGYSALTTPKLNESQIAENLIDDTFSSQNMLALVVPSGDYDKEAALLKELEGREGDRLCHGHRQRGGHGRLLPGG